MYTELALEAGVKSMLDAHITYDDVEAGIACHATGITCSGQRVFYQFGMTGIPIYNVNNACATGSTGIHLARNLVLSGIHDCVLVVGFEQMESGPLVAAPTDRPTPSDLSVRLANTKAKDSTTPKNPRLFGDAGREYMEK
jgi:sterol carrier protein 2